MNFRTYLEAEWVDGKRVSGDDIPAEVLKKFTPGKHFVMVAPPTKYPARGAMGEFDDRDDRRMDASLYAAWHQRGFLLCTGLKTFLQRGTPSGDGRVIYVLELQSNIELWCLEGEQRNPFMIYNELFGDLKRLLQYFNLMKNPDGEKSYPGEITGRVPQLAKTIASMEKEITDFYRKVDGQLEIDVLVRELVIHMPQRIYDILNQLYTAYPKTNYKAGSNQSVNGVEVENIRRNIMARMNKIRGIDAIASTCPLADAEKLTVRNPKAVKIVYRYLQGKRFDGYQGDTRRIWSKESKKMNGIMDKIPRYVEEILHSFEIVDSQATFEKGIARVTDQLHSLTKFIMSLREFPREELEESNIRNVLGEVFDQVRNTMFLTSDDVHGDVRKELDNKLNRTFHMWDKWLRQMEEIIGHVGTLEPDAWKRPS